MTPYFFSHKIDYNDLIAYETALGEIFYFRVLRIEADFGHKKLFIKAVKENLNEVPIST